MCKNALMDLILAIRFSRDLREDRMRRFVEGADREQITLFPECLEDWIDEENSVRVIDVFVDELDLAELRVCGVDRAVTVPPTYRLSILPRLYMYDYPNQVQSRPRLGHRASRKVAVM